MLPGISAGLLRPRCLAPLTGLSWQQEGFLGGGTTVRMMWTEGGMRREAVYHPQVPNPTECHQALLLRPWRNTSPALKAP